MGDRDRKDMVGVGHEWSGLKRCGGGRRQAIRLELMRWEWDTSGCARIDMVGVEHEWSGSKQHGGDRRQVVALELTRWGWEMSSWARNNVVEAGDE